MISEEQQDQAALYALGLLDADEDAAFKSELRANAELRDLVRELREAAGDLALTAPSLLPPASLKQRIMGDIALETKRVVSMPAQRASFSWIPWAIAAGLAVFCGLLAFDRVRLERQLADIRAVDPLMQTTFFSSRAICACSSRCESDCCVATWPSKWRDSHQQSPRPAAGQGLSAVGGRCRAQRSN